MKTLGICAMFLTVFLGCVLASPRSQAQKTPEGLISSETFEKNAADPTVLFRLRDNENFASGVVIKQDKDKAIILTARHITRRGENIAEFTIEQLSPAREPLVLPAFSGQKVIKFSDELDLMLVETLPIWPSAANVLSEKDFASFRPYTQCFVFGYPGASGRPTDTVHMTSGYISQFSGSNRMRLSAPGIYGISGGGVWVFLNGKLTLVGIYLAIHTVDGHRSHPIEHIGEASEPAKLLEFLTEGS